MRGPSLASARPRTIEAPSSGRTTRTLPTIGVDELWAPLPARTWVVERLRIAGGGRPTLLIGPPASGKTITAQMIALACASGREWCGHRVERCSVLHLDAEVGAWLTASRYQRIGRAMKVSPTEIGDRLRVAIYPRITLDSPDAEEVLTATCSGFGLVLLDSLSALAGAAEEHTPAIGALMLMLARVSGATGAAIVVLHHTRRDGEIRGSTAIMAGAECAWRWTAVERGRSTIVHERSPMGDPQPDLVTQIADVPFDGDARAGLTVRVVDADFGEGDLIDQVVAVARATPGCTLRHMRTTLGGRAKAVDAAIGAAIRAGRLDDRSGDEHQHAYHANGGGE